MILSSISAATAVSSIVGIFSLGVLVLSAFFVSKTKAAQQTVAFMSAANQAQKNQIETQALQIQTSEKRIEDLEKHLHTERQRSQRQDNEIAELRTMVQGIDAIKDLSLKIDRHHTELVALIGKRAA